VSGRGVLAIAVSVVMLAAVAAGLWINGTPNHQRLRAQDERRASLLTGLATRLEAQVSLYGTLPENLAEIAVESERLDPVTKTPFGYTHKGTDYRLCAVFAMAGEEGAAAELPFRRHAEGRVCFDRSADVKKTPGAANAYYLGTGRPSR
jgi:hypothetical protein